MIQLSKIFDRRFEGRVTSIALMSLGLIERTDGGWRITNAGRFAFSRHAPSSA